MSREHLLANTIRNASSTRRKRRHAALWLVLAAISLVLGIAAVYAADSILGGF